MVQSPAASKNPSYYLSRASQAVHSTDKLWCGCWVPRSEATLTTVPAITTQETSPLAPSAENVAREVSLLIEMAHECIALKGTDQIASLVLVDANPETAALVMNVNDPIFWTVAADVDPYSAWGVEAEHKLTWEKWDAFRAAEAAEKYKLIARKEDFENYMPNFETLRKKELSKKQPLVGDKSGYVIVGTRSRFGVDCTRRA